MALSQEEREKIYLEEKARRESPALSNGTALLLSGLAILGLAGIFYLSNKLEEKQVSIDDLRKAYPGLSPDEQE